MSGERIILFGNFIVKRVVAVFVGIGILAALLVWAFDPGAIADAQKETVVWRIVLYVVLANIASVLVGIAFYWLWRWVRRGGTA